MRKEAANDLLGTFLELCQGRSFLRRRRLCVNAADSGRGYRQSCVDDDGAVY